MTHIAIIGECMIELNGSPFGNMHQSYGGDTLNAAIYLNRSAAVSNPMSSNNTANPAIQTSYVTALGSDAISQEMLNRWQDEGLSTEFVLINEQRSPGLYLIQLDDFGERTFLYWRNDSAARYMVQHPDFNKIANQLRDVDMVFLSGISLAILPHSDQLKLLTIIEGLRERGVTIAFDSNYRPKLWSSEAATKECYLLGYKTTDIALVTFDDEQLLWSDQTPQDTITRLHALGVKTVIVKLGAEGCLISENPANEPVKITTTPVETVVDSTSAGDSFNGGFLSCYLAGGSIEEACHQGNALARLVIQHHGAIIPKPITDTLSN
ncbi:2-dehydro-3-deoxygluconokinase [Vibrio chagasii]|uniref:sugar kinase n=1 Tax=Vibrio chagasii TaxID=170679 RepID=UPI001EFCBF42|nr:sugar kinase [Vibrio chagasii]MCG9560141.1 sugar kinase [Vibrio chagasii]CAH6839135.1 2-dehydro-3-deoxygluconokinase [Vibrio chagasii]CAH6852767.1 2-dehydro-3-deoxygluconokinase [Vibrio chagasii]CAH6855309.1 2-dehydro-3-deoxygluconokinase [Vibrio chagasii]CAH6903521.1 2-dehydro-3-deoxygluconokinase [Vibrio chagasii]